MRTIYNNSGLRIFIINFLFVSIIFSGLAYVFMDGRLANGQKLSAISLFVSIIVFAAISQERSNYTQDFETNSNKDRLQQFLFLIINPILFAKNFDNSINYIKEIVTVIISLLLFNLLNLFFTLGIVDFHSLNSDYNANFGSLIKQVFTLNIFLSQVGGLFFQSILVYFIGIILDTKIEFKTYFRCVGLSYVGYLLSAVILFVYNLITINHFGSLAELTSIMSTSYIRIVIGKIGEYWSLSVLGLLIYNSSGGNLNVYWSLFNALFPSFMILLSSILFNQWASI